MFSTVFPAGTSLTKISLPLISTFARIFNEALPVNISLSNSILFFTKTPPVEKSGIITSLSTNSPLSRYFTVKSITSPRLKLGNFALTETAIPSISFTRILGNLTGRTTGSKPSPSSAGFILQTFISLKK